jgi:hypothetical protein
MYVVTQASAVSRRMTLHAVDELGAVFMGRT